MRIGRLPFWRALGCGLATALLLACTASVAAAQRPAAKDEMLFRIKGGGHLLATSSSYDRAEVAPVVSMIDALPHGPELSGLGLDVATPAEILGRCGEETIACYDPREDEMVIDGQDEELDGVSRLSLIAHEYGHHIANNREGGIWSAFDAGTLRWSTYEQVCERTREGELFPGNEGAHYWENPGEAFAQTYATLVEPQTPWPYTPLLAPDETALKKLREDVLDPIAQRTMKWQVGSPSGRGPAIGEALPVEGASFTRTFKAPFDGRVTVHLRAQEGGRYRVSLFDASTGELLSQGVPGRAGRIALHFADCGHRLLEARAEPTGAAAPFTAEIIAP
jgi:hypothetical protein